MMKVNKAAADVSAQVPTDVPADVWRKEWLEKTRKLVEESDDVVLPEDGRYYDRLHEKIMAAIEEADERSDEGSDVPDGAKQSWTDLVMGALYRKFNTRAWERA